MNSTPTRPRRDPRFNKLQAAATFYRAATFVLLLIVFVLSSVIIWQARSDKFGRAIRIDGKIVCFVRNEKAAERTRKQLLEEQKGDMPGPAFLEQKWEDLNWPLEKGDTVLRVDRAVELLRDKVTIKVAAAAVTRGDRELVVLRDKDEAEMVLTALKNKYIEGPGELTKSEFLESDVLIVDTRARPKAILEDVDKAIEVLQKPIKGTEKYVVLPGDSWRKIADDYHTSVSALRKLNPKVDDPLQINVTLTVSVPQKPLTVVTVKQETQAKKYDAPPETKETPTMAKGERDVARKGTPGVKRVSEKVTYHNGREVSREVTDEQVTKKAIPELIRVGTAEPSEDD